VRRAALVLVALALTGCETTAEKSAKLEREAKHLVSHQAITRPGLSIARVSTDVEVLQASIVRSSEGAAAVVTLRNDSSHALQAVPIAITVKDARGGTLFQNDAAGLEPALTSIAYLPAHGEATWVDDQVPQAGPPAGVDVRIGEAPVASEPIPRIEVERLRSSEESGPGALGSVRNDSSVAQRQLVIYVVARRAGQIVAAGRAVLPELPPRASAPFQVLFVGAGGEAKLQASAPPTTLG
jgi:hypothetical protein